MIYRPQNGDAGKSYDANEYWHRKQGGPKVNRFAGEGALAPADRDCDAEENFSYGKQGYAKPKDKTTTQPVKSNDIWDEEPWKEKQ